MNRNMNPCQVVVTVPNRPAARLPVHPGLSWSHHALSLRSKQKCFRASQRSVVSPVSPLPGVSIQDEGKIFADLASPVMKIAFVVHDLSWK